MAPVDPWSALLLFAAAYAAGAINAVAGGGSLVSFPTLVAVGLPAIQANVTNTVALWPGYLGGSLNYRRELAVQRARLRALALPSVLGSLAGAWLLLATPARLFELVVPFLILGACGLMAAQDRLNAWVARHHPGVLPGAPPGAGRAPPLLWLSTFVLGAYGAYFGAALGIMLLAVLGVLLPDDIQRSNALKGLLSLVMNAVAVVAFALFADVAWGLALVMAAGALLGGWSGVGAARRLGRVWLRRVVIGYGTGMALLLLARLLGPG